MDVMQQKKSCRMILTSNHSTEYTSYEKHDIP